MHQSYRSCTMVLLHSTTKLLLVVAFGFTLNVVLGYTTPVPLKYRLSVRSTRRIVFESPPQNDAFVAIALCATSSSEARNEVSGTADESKGSSMSSLQYTDTMETWLNSFSEYSCINTIQHGLFGRNGELRGLQWDPTRAVIQDNQRVTACTIPSDAVLTSDYTNKETWDVELVQQLWDSRSDKNGYVTFLSNNVNGKDGEIPPYTSPNAFRHWSTSEKQYLKDVAAESSSKATNSVAKLTVENEKQQTLWKRTFTNVMEPKNSDMSYQQFEWYMEAIHSRAFCGIGGGRSDDIVSSSSPTEKIALLAPILCGGAGFLYYQMTFPTANEIVFVGLGVLAVLPTILSIVLSSSPNSTTAVLLPLIDSANHDANADSSIDFNPITKCYELQLTKACVLPTEEKQQVCINYGAKSDIEWLLNYGFLPSFNSDTTTIMNRQQIANAFIQRNS